MIFITIASFISAVCFVICTIVALFFALSNTLAISVGFAILACWWFILTVIFGFVYLNRRR
jgi:multidrug transporter EmrE-like cation transporter